MNFRRIVLGISGASGTPYALALARALSLRGDIELHGIISDGARQVFQHELKTDAQELESCFTFLHSAKALGACMASGSWEHHGMVVCPCSMASLAAIASGAGTHLIHRAADVSLKERRPLILVAREMPLNQIHLRNMLTLQQAGAVIMPPCPGFYHAPQTVQDILNQVVGRILEQLGLEHSLYTRWS